MKTIIKIMVLTFISLTTHLSSQTWNPVGLGIPNPASRMTVGNNSLIITSGIPNSGSAVVYTYDGSLTALPPASAPMPCSGIVYFGNAIWAHFQSSVETYTGGASWTPSLTTGLTSNNGPRDVHNGFMYAGGLNSPRYSDGVNNTNPAWNLIPIALNTLTASSIGQINTYGGNMYMAGANIGCATPSFSMSSGTATGNIVAILNNSNLWSGLPKANLTSALCAAEMGGVVFVGTQTGVYRWNSPSWVLIAGSPTTPVMDLAVYNSGSGDRLYAMTSNAIFEYDGTNTTQIATTLGTFSDMEIYDCKLFVSGTFTSVNSVPATNIASWSKNINLIVSGTPTIACFGGSVNVSVIATDGLSPYTYTWASASNTNVSNGSAYNAIAGTYTVSVRACNASTAIAITVTQPSAITSSIAISNAQCFGGTGGGTITASGGTGSLSYGWSSGSSISSATLAGGLHTYTITDSNGCKNSGTVTITQPTSITVTSSTSIACYGLNGSATVFANGGTGTISFSWSTSGTSTNISAPSGNYTVTATDANGCFSSATVFINQNSAINVSATSNSITGTANANGGSGSYTYSWSTGSTGSSVALPNGTHTVTVTDALGCSSTATVYIDVEGNTTGIQSHSINLNLKVYPNPTAGMLNVEYVGHLEVFDIGGRLIMSSEVDGKIEIDLVPGIYVLRLDGKYNHKVIKQ